MPIAERLERFKRQPFDFVISVPPRHGKSTLLLHFVVWALKQDPSLDIAYISYNEEQAKTQSRIALSIAERAGLELTKASSTLWTTKDSNRVGVLWTGVGGSLTGKGFDIILVDDPIKNRLEAESPRKREAAWEMYQNDIVTRLEPGSSFACVQTRWHHQDLAGKLTQTTDEEFEPLPYVNLPAIENEDSSIERPLWPERWPLHALKRRRSRVGTYAWASLFQGRPVPKGATVFGEPHFYDAMPTVGYSLGQGIDLSYTEKKTADYSVVVTMAKLPPPPRKPGEEASGPLFYVTRVVRRQKRAPDFKSELRAERAKAGHCRARFYGAGTELGAVDFMRQADTSGPGVQFDALPPRGDKFTRAIGFAAAWNEGRILLPSPELAAQEPARYEWVNEYLDELRSFTGVSDAHDDMVDASVAAFDLLAAVAPSYDGLPEIKSPRRM